MALFNESQLRQRATSYKQSDARLAAKSYDQILQESRQAIPLGTEFDIFLSHSFSDAELVLGLMVELMRSGYKVYVDWVIDSQLDRSSVSKETADLLRKRMKDSKSLFYASTENTERSKWMPWETGYFDAKKELVAIVPIARGSSSDKYEGVEYLGLYPYVTGVVGADRSWLYIHEDEKTWVRFDDWLKGQKPKKH